MTKFNESSSEGIFRPGSVSRSRSHGVTRIKKGWVRGLWPQFMFFSQDYGYRHQIKHALSSDFWTCWHMIHYGQCLGLCSDYEVKGHVEVTRVNDLNCVKILKQGQMEKLNRVMFFEPWWKIKISQDDEIVVIWPLVLGSKVILCKFFEIF